MGGQKSAAADIAATRIYHRLGVSDGHRGVDGVAPLAEDVGTGLGGQALSGDDEAGNGFDRRKRGGLRRKRQDEPNEEATKFPYE
jgi:hypothetical protein